MQEVYYENNLNPDEAVRIEIAPLYEPKGVKPRDALHLASAVVGGADYFLTCDDRLLKKQRALHLTLKMMNPIDFIRKEGVRIL